MKIGISVVTCDRPNYLLSTITSLNVDENAERVIVDNGINTRKKVEKIAKKMGYQVLDGKQSNSPHGQNLAFNYLLGKGCDIVLKSDDDLLYEPNYLDNLLSVLLKYGNKATAASGVCWSTSNLEYISYMDKKGFTTTGGIKINTEQFSMYRFTDTSIVWKARHLTGAFLYRTKDALELQKLTKDLRGGAFGEYFSPVAGREETEFTLLLRQILHKDLLVVPSASVFHQYAPGGTRRFNVGKLVQEDNVKFLKVCKDLNINSITSPAWIEPVEKISASN